MNDENNTQQAAPGRILVIDDEAIALRNLVHVLKKEGYEVTGRQSAPAP